MRIIYIHKDKFQKRPPVISAVMILNDLGHKVTVITENMSEYWANVFEERNMDYLMISSDYGQGGLKGVFSKIKSYICFRNKVKSFIEEIKRQGEEPLLWIEGAQTIVSLGTFIKKYRYVLQIQELHTNSKLQLRSIGKVISSASAVFMPEYNRTVLYKVWFNLEKRPYVLPNKPYFLPSETDLRNVKAKYQNIFNDLRGKKIILYQGWISKVRNLDNFINAAKTLGDDFMFVLLGPNQGGTVETLKPLWENVCHIDFIPAPDYLAITSIAYIGIVSYIPNTLNNAYCAPNKMYEYGAFGIPMVGNEIPGLKLIEDIHAGVLVDESDINSVAAAYKKIIAGYDTYSQSAKKLYSSTNNKQTIEVALNNLK